MAQQGMQGGHVTGGMMDHDNQMQIGQQMAIQMSEPSTKFESPEVEAFAAHTVNKQTAELKELEGMQKKS